MFYSQERKASAGPDDKLPSAAVLAKEAAPLYRALDPATKADLIEKSDAQRAAYPDILAAYTASLSPAQIKEENAIRSRRRKAGLSNRRNLRVPGAPKRPLTGYMTFVAEVRKERPEVIEGISNVLEQSKAIAQEWKALTEEKRQVSWLPCTSGPAIAGCMLTVSLLNVHRSTTLRPSRLGKRTSPSWLLSRRRTPRPSR